MKNLLALLLLGCVLVSCSSQQSNIAHPAGQMEPHKIKSITIGLPVSNLNEATDWYRELLGNPEVINPAPDVSELSLTSTSWLQLFQVENSKSNPTILRFESNDIVASHELALKHGVQVGDVETVPGFVKYFDFKDPYGNALSFYELLAE